MGTNLYAEYQQQSTECWPRVDMLLALFDELIRKLEKAREAFSTHESDTAQKLIQRCQLVIGGLISGVIPDSGELASNCLRTYEFALFSLEKATLSGIEDALRSLKPLWEGFQKIREEAIQLERNGEIPVIENSNTLEVTV